LIDLKTYNKAKKIFNKYLLGKNTSIYTISNPILSIISEHSRHTELLNKNTKNNLFLIFLKFYFFSFPILVLFFIIKKFFSKKINIEFKTKTLIFSHLIDKAFLDKNQDYIFGNIFKKITKDVSFLYLSALKSHKKKNSSEKNKRFNYDYILLDNDYKYVKIKDLLKIFLNCLLERSKLINEAKKKKNIKERNLFLLAANLSFSSSSIINLIRYFAIFEVIKKTKPKNVITTFEGHPLEKLIFFASHINNLNIKRIAYQNTFILKNQNSMFLKLKKDYLPDEIWLSGSIYLNRFKKIFSKIIKIRVLGSSRKFLLSKKINKSKFKKNICLVIPEGFYSTTSDLMKFCIKYSNSYSNIKKFVFRIHPELNINILFKKYPELKNYKNFSIEISKNFDPKIDLLRCNFCLYRQTTLVSQAILFGLKAFYLVDKKNINVDSIYLVKRWKEYIYSEEDLMHKIERFNSKKNKFKDLQKAQNLCKKFYTNIDYKLIKKL
jgi:hypothetical protein